MGIDGVKIYRELFINASLNNLIVYSLAFFAALVIFKIALYDKNKLLKAIDHVIFIHAAALVTQAIVYYSAGSYFDFVEFFTGAESRYLDYFCSQNCRVRFTGLLIEPSTFTTVFFSLIAIRLCLDYKASNYYLLFVIFIVLLSASYAGYFQAILLLTSVTIARFAHSRKKIITFAIVVFLAGVFYLLPSDYSFLLERLSVTSIQRIRLLEYLYNSRIENMLFGHGLFSFRDDLYLYASGEVITGRYTSVNDLGILPYMVIKIGLPLTLLLASIMLIKKVPLHFKFLLLVFFTTKLGLQHILFWCFPMIYMISKKNET